MSSSVEDIYTHGLSMLSAALDARSEQDAIELVRAIARDLSPEDLVRVATWLAVESVWRQRPRRSRRAMREWVELRKFAVLTSNLGDADA